MAAPAANFTPHNDEYNNKRRETLFQTCLNNEPHIRSGRVDSVILLLPCKYQYCGINDLFIGLEALSHLVFLCNGPSLSEVTCGQEKEAKHKLQQTPRHETPFGCSVSHNDQKL